MVFLSLCDVLTRNYCQFYYKKVITMSYESLILIKISNHSTAYFVMNRNRILLIQAWLTNRHKMEIYKSFYYNGNIASLSGAVTKLCSGKTIHNYFSFFNNLIWYFPSLLNLLLVLSQIEFTWSWKLGC